MAVLVPARIRACNVRLPCTILVGTSGHPLKSLESHSTTLYYVIRPAGIVTLVVDNKPKTLLAVKCSISALIIHKINITFLT
jgi:hypothetical protein